jgi:predicted amidophosphoribosyltransferase
MGVRTELLEGFLGALFPERCLVCGAPVDSAGPCSIHRLELELDVARCARCAARLPRGIPDRARCATCANRSLGLRDVLAAGDYSQRALLRDWILALKHGGRSDLAQPLGLLLAATWLESMEASRPLPLLVPVPQHPLRRLQRGYDQAALLAAVVAKRTGARVLPCLSRRRWTDPQGSALAGRASNVAGAFQLKGRWERRPLRGDSVVLVDDVLASGSTLAACAKVLRQGGAQTVAALVLGRSRMRET